MVFSILLYCRLVVLESGLGLESGLQSIFAGLGLGLGLDLKGLGLGLGLETPGLGLVLGLGSFFCKSFFKSTCNLTTNSRNNVRRSEKQELKPESAHTVLTVTTYITLRDTFTVQYTVYQTGLSHSLQIFGIQSLLHSGLIASECLNVKNLQFVA